ncbi:hypothetical protein AVEN_195796-1 [Araneus ventricosus]|uniref:Uncharacterized protein n=1 Tax=Araneus ventricosus TaxID=182803 RepID=A0A4Y2V7Q9_ARAVE|nr:hypothetical protein AVEN_195796-1 [Araneus ventricosus]
MHGRRASGEPLDGAEMESIKREFSYTSSFLLWISEVMATYSNQEKADMHFMYGLGNRNALEAEILYRRRFPRRHVTDQKMFERLHRCLCETGSFVTGMHDTGRGRSVRTPQVVEDILQRGENRPDISTREVSHAVNVPHSIVWGRRITPLPCTESASLDNCRLCSPCRVCTLVFTTVSSAA